MIFNPNQEKIITLIYSGSYTIPWWYKITSKNTVTWSLKIDKSLNKTIQEVVRRLGYTSKAELTRDALREFIIRRKLYNLLDGEPTITFQTEYDPNEAIIRLVNLFKPISKNDIQSEIKIAREEAEKELL